jgi:hypothetical protein
VSRRTFVPAVAVPALAATLVVACPAAATISSPKRISSSNLHIQGVAVGAGGGRTAIVMDGYDPKPDPDEFEVFARLGTTTSLGPAQRLAGNGFVTGVAVGADGTAIAGWTQEVNGRQTWRVAIARPGKSFGSARTLGDSGVTSGDLAVTPNGRIVAIWRTRSSDRSVRVAIAPRGGWFQGAKTIGVARQGRPLVASGPDGTVVATWLDTPPAPQPPPAPPPSDRTAETRATTLAPNAPAFATPAALATFTYWGSAAPALSTGPGGVVISWPRFGEHGAEALAVATARRLVRLLPHRTFGSPIDLNASAPIAGIGLENKLALGLPSDLTISALWQDAKTKNGESDQLSSSVVKTSTRPTAGGRFSTAKTLSTSGWLAGGPEADALPDRTIAAWGETARTKPARLRIAVRSSGNWTLATPLKAPDLDTNSVTLAAGGRHVAVVWIQRTDPTRPGGRAYLATYRPS